MLEFVAPEVGGVKASDGTWIEGDEKINGAPPCSTTRRDAAVGRGCRTLAKEATARDFVNDAFAHAKFIAYNADGHAAAGQGRRAPISTAASWS